MSVSLRSLMLTTLLPFPYAQHVDRILTTPLSSLVRHAQPRRLLQFLVGNEFI